MTKTYWNKTECNDHGKWLEKLLEESKNEQSKWWQLYPRRVFSGSKKWWFLDIFVWIKYEVIAWEHTMYFKFSLKIFET